ncbi:HAD family hydrolase [Glycomyces albidus]|uniref:HAD-IA family hydrolase n=1 Tax=Glycomyces albidus TaxID=2656774 RepID=A0A6L5GAG8_9ACTN|nr:HAD family hydrolase [Glycomyces albidus]MQM26644.1 HAD-IA family hydrolase [Glycomyces albidus]
MRLDPEEVLLRKSLLMLDFDGPVCSVFAGYPAPQIALELITSIGEHSAQLAAVLKGESDPMEVLRAAARSLSRDRVKQIDEQLSRAEMKAVETAQPTAGMADLIEVARRAGIGVVIVSNNSSDPIGSYLTRCGLDVAVDHVIGRPFGRPEQMKPDPYLLNQALKVTGLPASRACFIGDSVTDVEAGRAAGVTTIGYANKPGKAERLERAGVHFVVDSF